ncbi:MAG: FAD-dependent oxidoreductase [Acidimicrobiia bacterium]
MRVAVIGGGIQGTCVALELATRGIAVDLIEANPTLMDEASRHNEGKIHLGFVYANDPSFRTAELMFRGASQFAPLMRRWLGRALDALPLSTPFNYVVHKDSLLSTTQLEEAYKEIAKRMRSVTSDGSYFGVEEPYVFTRQDGSDPRYRAVDAVFTTQEIAVNPGLLADLISKTVADVEGIRILAGTRVTAVAPSRRMVEAHLADGTALALGPYDHVVNCSWRGRPAIDATAGLALMTPWTFRMKYFLLAGGSPTVPSIPSTTIVLGGFGDVVDYGTGEFYLCWYPSGRLGWSSDLTPPQWPTRPDPSDAIVIARNTLTSLASVVPGVEVLMAHRLEGSDVRGGVIFSLGDTDIDDPDSRFHKRSEVGLRSQGQYHSVDTGKYTTAPLFALEAADRITGMS